MIILKNGDVLDYTSDFDLFFKKMIEGIITSSRSEAETAGTGETEDHDAYQERFLKNIMDNCIYVTHQVFELQKENPEFSKFIVTGFLFNSIIMSLPLHGKGQAGDQAEDEEADDDDSDADDDGKIVH